MSFEEIRAEVKYVKGVALSGKEIHISLDVLLFVKILFQRLDRWVERVV